MFSSDKAKTYQVSVFPSTGGKKTNIKNQNLTRNLQDKTGVHWVTTDISSQLLDV